MSRGWIVHPVLLAIFPTLFLYQYNSHTPVAAARVAQWIGVSVLALGLLWLVLTAVLRDPRRGALATSFAGFLLLTYGHVAAFMDTLGARAAGVRLEADAPVIALPWLLVLAAGVFALARLRRGVDAANAVANRIAVGLLVVSLAGVALGPGGAAAPPNADLPAPQLDTGDATPNVYYIVLDEYANGAILRDHLEYDNGPFLEALRERGFHVTNRTSANYPRTFQSVASTLNMQYLDGVVDEVGTDSPSTRSAFQLIQDSAVARALKDGGYRVVHFDSGWAGTEWSPLADQVVDCDRLSEFDRVFIGTTALALAKDRLLAEDHRAGVRCQFDELARVAQEAAETGEPTFTFAHFILPHGPYVFGPNGEPRDGVTAEWGRDLDRDVARQPYLDQLTYTNQRVLEAVDAILAAESRTPVIVLQSDHGTPLLGDWDAPNETFLKGRFWNLNAILLPDADPDTFPDPLTNVNTFRVVLSEAFGADLQPLDDRHWFGPQDAPYRFTNVTTDVRFPEA